MPVLFFGNLEAYWRSPTRVLTAGLNPSRMEFPTEDPFRRFPEAAAAGCSEPYDGYLAALTGYFENPAALWRWFGSYEHVLAGAGCSYGSGSTNTALHTDLCSPIATNPSWSRLAPSIQDQLKASGVSLWLDLIDRLQPDLVLASVARTHLAALKDRLPTPWRTIHRIDRPIPYDVCATRLSLKPAGSALLVWGRAVNVPFGSTSNQAKREIGRAAATYLENDLVGA